MKKLGLRFVPAVKKESKPKRISNKVVEGYCIIDIDGSYKIHVDVDDKGKLLLPFTDDSFDTTGREIVFDIKPDKHGIKTMYIRRDRELRIYPGVTKTPIAENRRFSGYIVKHDGKLKFQLKAYIGYGCGIKTSEDG